MSNFTKISIAVALAIVSAATAGHATNVGGTQKAEFKPTYSIDLSKLNYRKTPFKGVTTTLVYGRRNGPYLYATHAKVEAGSVIPPHTHPNDLTTVVTSGTAFVGTGTKIDQTKLKAYPAGTFFITPAGSPHFIVAKDGAFSVLDHGRGPTGFRPVK